MTTTPKIKKSSSFTRRSVGLVSLIYRHLSPIEREVLDVISCLPGSDTRRGWTGSRRQVIKAHKLITGKTRSSGSICGAISKLIELGFLITKVIGKRTVFSVRKSTFEVNLTVTPEDTVDRDSRGHDPVSDRVNHDTKQRSKRNDCGQPVDNLWISGGSKNTPCPEGSRYRDSRGHGLLGSKNSLKNAIPDSIFLGCLSLFKIVEIACGLELNAPPDALRDVGSLRSLPEPRREMISKCQVIALGMAIDVDSDTLRELAYESARVASYLVPYQLSTG